MATKIKQEIPNQMEINESGDLSGLAFLIPGLALVLIGFGVIMINESFVPGMGFFGLIFFITGIHIVSNRRRITIDTIHQDITSSHGWFIPSIENKHFALSEYKGVNIEFDLNIDANGDSKSFYYILFASDDRSKNISIGHFKTYGEVYDQAAKIASFINFPIIEYADIIKPEDIHNQLQARLKADTWLNVDTPPPADMKSRIQGTTLGVIITIPIQLTGQWVYIIAQFIVFTITLLSLASKGFAVNLSGLSRGDLIFTGIVILLIFAPMIALYFAHLKAKKSRVVVSVDSQNITIEYLFFKMKYKKIDIPIREIVDVYCESANSITIYSSGVIIKTRSTFYSFGVALPLKEVEYLTKVVKKQLVNE